MTEFSKAYDELITRLDAIERHRAALEAAVGETIDVTLHCYEGSAYDAMLASGCVRQSVGNVAWCEHPAPEGISRRAARIVAFAADVKDEPKDEPKEDVPHV